MSFRAPLTPTEWLQDFCQLIEGEFLFFDPVSWQTFQLTKGATTVLGEAADAIEQHRFRAFLSEIDEAGGWPAELEFLARGLTTVNSITSPAAG